MASSSRSAAPPVGGDIKALQGEIYEACYPLFQENPKSVFHQAELLDFDIIPHDDVTTLLSVVQGLVNEKLFKTVTDSEGMGWKVRTQDEAKKYVHPRLQHT